MVSILPKKDNSIKSPHELASNDTRLSMRSFFDLSSEDRQAIVSKAAADAIQESHAAGITTTHRWAGRTYRLYPDGRKEILA